MADIDFKINFFKNNSDLLVHNPLQANTILESSYRLLANSFMPEKSAIFFDGKQSEELYSYLVGERETQKTTSSDEEIFEILETLAKIDDTSLTVDKTLTLDRNIRKFQHLGLVFQDSNFQNGNGFLHIFEYSALDLHRNKVEARFYLGLDSKSAAEFSKDYMILCKEKNIPAYFKILKNDERGDNIVIYTSYQDAQTNLDAIKEIKQKRPELFKNAIVPNKLLAKIDNVIGFGEEPTVKDDENEKFSFTTLRAKYITEFRKILYENGLVTQNVYDFTQKDFDNFTQAMNSNGPKYNQKLVFDIISLNARYDMNLKRPHLNGSTITLLKENGISLLQADSTLKSEIKSTKAETQQVLPENKNKTELVIKITTENKVQAADGKPLSTSISFPDQKTKEELIKLFSTGLNKSSKIVISKNDSIKKYHVSDDFFKKEEMWNTINLNKSKIYNAEDWKNAVYQTAINLQSSLEEDKQKQVKPEAKSAMVYEIDENNNINIRGLLEISSNNTFSLATNNEYIKSRQELAAKQQQNWF